MSETTKDPKKVLIGNPAYLARFSYAKVFIPESIEDGGPKIYSTAVLIDKNDTKTVELINAAVEAAKEAGKSKKWGGKIPANLKLPLRDGDKERPDDPVYAGMWFINANMPGEKEMPDGSKKIVPGPDVVGLFKDENGKYIGLDENSFYSGCYGRVTVNFFPFSAAGNKGVGAGLGNIQKIKDGERLAGGASASEDFNDDEFADYQDDGDESMM